MPSCPLGARPEPQDTTYTGTRWLSHWLLALLLVPSSSPPPPPPLPLPPSCLCSAADMTVPAQDKALVPTDIAVAIPDGCYGRVGE